MKTLIKKALGYLIRKLTIYYENGINLGDVRNRRRLKKIGINYQRYKLFDKKWLLNSNINTIIDIGANIGEFTAIFGELFPEATIYAFEPLPDCYEQLVKRAENYTTVKAFNIGLGNEKGSLNIQKSSWHPASSFREMGELHKQNYPYSAQSEDIKVRVDTLDNILRDKRIEKNILIKLDVQGFEDEVIKGGMQIFKQAKIVVVECSFQELYKNEPLFDGIYSLLKQFGFRYRGSLKQSFNKDNDTYLQADCIFISGKNEYE